MVNFGSESMKIFSSEQIKELDRLTCTLQGITALDLMERASIKAYDCILKLYNCNDYLVVVGMGDNGGDGFVIARKLHEAGKSVKLFVIEHREAFSDSTEVNYQRFTNLGGKCKFMNSQSLHTEIVDQINSETVVIDAIFGIGLTGELQPWIQRVLSTLDKTKKIALGIISIDIPSGISNNGYAQLLESNVDEPFVKCDYLLSFQVPKLPFFYPEFSQSYEKLILLDIGLETELYIKAYPNNEKILETSCFFSQAPLFITRKRGAHKGKCGHLLVIGGSYGKMGAALLTSKAAIHSGAGMVTAHIPKCGYQIMQIAVPDVMISADKSEINFSTLPSELVKYDVFAIGPGLGTSSNTSTALKNLLQQIAPQDMGTPVIDADAINIIASNPKLLEWLPVGSILTPHLKELERLIGVSASASHLIRLSETRSFCQKYHVNIVIKGPNSAIVCSNGNIYFNPTGNQGLATAGSGDVLTGIIAGILSEGSYLPAQAAILGCYIHGLAADIMASKVGFASINASDLINHLGYAFKQLENSVNN